MARSTAEIAVEKMEAALKPFGWTCGPDFWERYYSDPWVFNLANAVEALSEDREQSVRVSEVLDLIAKVRREPWRGGDWSEAWKVACDDLRAEINQLAGKAET